MSLFSTEDFDETVDFLMTLPGKLSDSSVSSLSPDNSAVKSSVSPKTRNTRADKLREVFNAFDIDRGGTIGEDELLQLGQARRKTGQATGEWTVQRNRRLIARMTEDNGASGNITESEFVGYFDDILPGDPDSFERETDNFLKVAQMCGGGGGSKATRKPKASPDTRKPPSGPDVSTRTPREREANLRGIIRILSDRGDSVQKKALTHVSSAALQRADWAGSWSTNENKNAIDNLHCSRGTITNQDCIYFFKSIWYGGLENMSDGDYDKAYGCLRSISRDVQDKGIPTTPSPARRSPSKKDDKLSDDERKLVREKNTKLREIFSLLDFKRRGDLYRADLKVLGVLAQPLLDYMNEEGIECVSSSPFLEILGGAMSNNTEEFNTQAEDLESRAKASHEARKAERRAKRVAKLEHVFSAFDIDNNGVIDREELFELGTARRTTGQKRGSWTEEKNRRLVEKLDVNEDGQVSKDEFTEHFAENLTYNQEEFDDTMSDFIKVAEHVHLERARQRQLQLANMEPIERAKHEAIAFTKDSDIEIFKARQELVIREEARIAAEKIALDKTIKELLAKQNCEIAKEELAVTYKIEAKTKQRKEELKEEHKVAEQQQEASVKVEAGAADDMEATIQATQDAHQAHKKVAKIHQEAVAVVDMKGAAKAQRAQEVADLEELLRLALQAFGIAEQEFEVASIDESKKAEEEKAARDVLNMAKQRQAAAEEAHRSAHADMVEKTKAEKEKHQAKKYEEHKHVLVSDMADAAIGAEKAVHEEYQQMKHSALKYARIVAIKRDDFKESELECEVSVDEKRVRAVEETAAVDWWDAESSRQMHQKAQLNAAEKKETLKKAELHADWEEKRSVFARNRNRDPSEITAAVDKKDNYAQQYADAKGLADKSKLAYSDGAAKARDTTNIARITREDFETQIEPKRQEIALLRAQMEGLELHKCARSMQTYKEFLHKAVAEISAAGAVDEAALFARVERAVEMAMKGVDIYSSIPEKPLRSAREPAPRREYLDEEYMPPAPAEFDNTPSPVKRSIPSDAPQRDIPKASPRNQAYQQPWLTGGANTPLVGPASSESPVNSPRNRADSAADARNERDNRLNNILPSVDGERSQFENQEEQQMYETLIMAHKFFNKGDKDNCNILLDTVTSQAVKTRFNELHGTSY
jgi:Ca2+-binding EF-hand superfamily protein